jgi:hypothetical protein
VDRETLFLDPDAAAEKLSGGKTEPEKKEKKAKKAKKEE